MVKHWLIGIKTRLRGRKTSSNLNLQLIVNFRLKLILKIGQMFFPSIIIVFDHHYSVARALHEAVLFISILLLSSTKRFSFLLKLLLKTPMDKHDLGSLWGLFFTLPNMFYSFKPCSFSLYSLVICEKHRFSAKIKFNTKIIKNYRS